jgi:hypothetical protein
MSKLIIHTSEGTDFQMSPSLLKIPFPSTVPMALARRPPLAYPSKSVARIDLTWRGSLVHTLKDNLARTEVQFNSHIPGQIQRAWF